MTTRIITNEKEMKELGKELAKTFPILFLNGDLWAGKTILTKGFAEGLGIDPQKVQSPTYTYLNGYDNKLLHLDLYRLESFDELIEKGILNEMEDYDYIVIERPKWKENFHFSHYGIIDIKKIDNSTREVDIQEWK